MSQGDIGPISNLSQLIGVLGNPGTPLQLSGITGLSAVWDTTSPDQLDITWNFDTTLSNNQYLYDFVITFVTPDGAKNITTLNFNKTSTTQTYNLTKTNNQYLFGIFHGTTSYPFTSISVYARDQFTNVGASQTITSIPVYSAGLPTPIITAYNPITNGYTVTASYQVGGVTVTPAALPTQTNFSYLQIQEWVDTTSTITSASNIPGNAVYVPVSLGTLNPTTIYSSDTNWRWIKAYFTDSTGASTSSASAVYGPVKPNPVAIVNTTPPTDVVAASAAFISSGAGSDIVVTFTLPSTNYGESFIVKLIPTAASGLSGQFYYFPTGLTASQVVSFTIPKSSIFAQFGSYYSTYTGTVYSVSAVGNISLGTASTAQIGSFSHTNGLSGVTPTIAPVAAANGYTVTWANYTGATYADVYESTTSAVPTDESTRVYSGSSPVTIQSLNYSTRYITIRLYDDYGNTSNYSAPKAVTPYDPGLLSLLSNPVAFQTNGSILAGSYNSSTGSLSSPNVIFNTSGIYATDASGTPTTQIINNAGSQATTFITQRAQIADWTISPTKIENTLYGSGGSSTYVGLSGSSVNGYAIWAGSPTAGGAANANFTVTSSGYVTARNINIIGNGTGSVLLSAGGVFSVTNAGVLNATAANITGTLTISGGSTFAGNVSIGSGASVYARTTGPNSGQGVAFNYNGLSAYDAGGAQTTSINAGAAAGTPTFTTTNALIGNWNITATAIQNAASPSIPTFLLNSGTASSANSLQIYDTTSRVNLLQLSTGIGGNFIQAGPTALPNFAVSTSGILTATGAIIKANNSTTNTMTIDSTGLKIYGTSSVNPVVNLSTSGAIVVTGSVGGGKASALDTSTNGFYFDGSSGSSSGWFSMGGANANVSWNGTRLAMVIPNPGFSSAYVSTPAYGITLGSSGTLIAGLPVQQNTIVGVGGTVYSILDDSQTYYLGVSGLGSIPRQRMVVESPANGTLSLGMAVYYQNSAGTHITPPTGSGGASSGFVGDLWVVY